MPSHAVGSLSRGAYSWEQSGPSKRHRFWGSAISQNFRLSVLEAQSPPRHATQFPARAVMAVFAKKLAAEIGTSNAAMRCPTRNPQPAHDPPTALGPMAELETPYRLLRAFRYFMGAALPFIFLWVGIEKGLEGQSYR